MKINQGSGSNGGSNFNSSNSYSSYYPNLGITVIKKKPRKRKKNEWSDKQKDARIRFTVLNHFAYANKTAIIKPIWNLSPEKRSSGDNLFRKYNSKAFGRTGEIVNPGALCASNGSLAAPIDAQIEILPKENNFKISWAKENFNYKNNQEDTLVYCTLYSEEFFQISYTDIKRKDLSAVLDIGSIEELNDYIYIFFTNKDRTAFSNSKALRIR